ncbi:hypothetical protein B398_11545 [Xylella fastidiosa 32]|nr:hypothetical protein XFFB_11110 [Xylella fastidiosa]ETE29555.1 hypothetical protein B398_11545 [Xylella fastidiosa 32]KXB21788.1 hypothetical protein ADT30_02740 [Xylella fastidiosa]OJZ69568.1 hypothetical protein B375_0210495 [Xylella fastidiosa 6c]
MADTVMGASGLFIVAHYDDGAQNYCVVVLDWHFLQFLQGSLELIRHSAAGRVYTRLSLFMP